QAQVVNLMQRLQEEKGITFLFIAHDLSMVKYISDRIGVMYFAKLVELAPSDHIYKHQQHEYTKTSLLAITLRDTEYEKIRSISSYDPDVHQYTDDEELELREVGPEHYVYCSEKEFAKKKENYNKTFNLSEA